MSLTLKESLELAKINHDYRMIELEKARQNIREEQRLIRSNINLKRELR